MLDPRETDFWHAAIRSGLMDAGKLTACWEAVDPAKRDQPDRIERRLARQAVQSRYLTLWQAQQLLAGRTTGYMVDRYRLLDVIGQGGMGRVYLARDTRLDRPVALKILSPDRLSNPRALARFVREARMGAKLQHENVVRIYDFGESNGKYFLVMEHIEGQSIATLIGERGPVPPATAARLVRQVALGLEHAHRKGLIHRDVNPFNILVTYDGTAKLTDMGLAVILATEERITRDGATVGTFDYIAPEQAKDSRNADTRSDIYSLGCTMYHMCSGQVPFPGPSLPEKLYGHQVIDPPPLSDKVPGLPEGLSQVVQRMMKKSPDERYATPIEVAMALAPYQEESYAGVGYREGQTPIFLPVGIGPAQPASDLAHRYEPGRAAASVKAAGPQPPTSVATTPDSGSYTSDSTAPLLTPDDDVYAAADEVRLILDPDPSPPSSVGLSPSRSRSPTDDRASADLAAQTPPWLTPARLWGFVVLAAVVTILLLILATVNSRGAVPRWPATGRTAIPARE
jgi:serine/threonine-protein kinase